MVILDEKLKEVLLKYENIREGLSLYLCKYNLFVAGLFEQVRHTFDHIARCYVLYQIGGLSPNEKEIVKNIERANNHIERLGLDILKSLMFAEEEYFGIFVKSYKEHLQIMIKEKTATVSSTMIDFLAVCDETANDIEKHITAARQKECTAKDIITKGESYEKAYQKICNKVKEVIIQCPINIKHRQVDNSLSKITQDDIKDETTTLREIFQFYWEYIKNAISWREIKRNEFDVNSLFSLVETLDYVAWHTICDKGLGNAKKNLQELHIKIHHSLLQSAKKDFDTMFNVIDSLHSIDKQFLDIKSDFHYKKQSIQNEIDKINKTNNGNSHDVKLTQQLTKCYENICKANKDCLSAYRKYKNEKTLYCIDFPIL